MLSTHLPAKTSCSLSIRLIFQIVTHTSGLWSVFHADFCQQGINNASLEKDTQHVSNKYWAPLSSFLMFWGELPHPCCWKCSQYTTKCISFCHLPYLFNKTLWVVKEECRRLALLNWLQNHETLQIKLK